MASEVLRKVIHIVFAFLLLLPQMFKEFLDPMISYGLLLMVAGWVYSIQVKGPPEWLHTFPQWLRGIQPQLKGVDFFLEQFNRYISMVERDYEKRAGWLGVLAGVIGVVASYVLFPQTSFFGITALALVDGISSIVGKLFGRVKIPLSDGTLEGTLAGALSYLAFLVAVGVDPLNSLAVSIAASLAELYGGEDNVSIPVLTSAVASLLLLQAPI